MDLDIIIYFFLQIFTQRNQLILIKGKFHGTIALSIWNIERAKIDNVLMRQSTARRSCQTFLIDSHQTFLGQWGSVIPNISRKRAAKNINCNIFTYIQGDFFIGCWGEIPIQKKDVNYCKNNLNQAVMRVHWRQFYSESLTSKFCTQQFRDNLHGL